MAYRISAFLLCAIFIACGNDSKGHNDAPPSSDGTNGGDGQSVTDGRPGDATVGAVCGTTTCDPGQECCTGGGSASMCVPLNTCTTVSFVCDGPEDCGGTQVCCYGNTGSGSAGTAGSECKNAAQCNTTACHVDADCTMQGATKCCPIAQTQYNICLPQCL